MNNEKKPPIFGHSNRGLPLFAIDARILDTKETVEKDLASSFEADSMLEEVSGRFAWIPDEVLVKVEEVKVHSSNVYTLYIEKSSDSPSFACTSLNLECESNCTRSASAA